MADKYTGIHTVEPTPERPVETTQKWETPDGGTVGVSTTDYGSGGQHSTVFVDDGQGNSSRVSVDSPSLGGSFPNGDTPHQNTHKKSQ